MKITAVIMAVTDRKELTRQDGSTIIIKRKMVLYWTEPNPNGKDTEHSAVVTNFSNVEDSTIEAYITSRTPTYFALFFKTGEFEGRIYNDIRVKFA